MTRLARIATLGFASERVTSPRNGAPHPMTAFVEQNCVFEHDGQSYEAGGAWLLQCIDGYRRGVVYAKPTATPPCVTDWHGNTISPARFGPIYNGPFCCMRSVTFTLDGVTFTGRYCPDCADAIRVRSSKPVGGAA